MAFLLQIVSVNGPSMLNTFFTNDKIVVEKITYYFSSPKRQDIILFRHNNEKYIKRVIAVENDKIKIVEDKVYVNGKLIKEPYAVYDVKNNKSKNDNSIHNLTETVVPRGMIFVMGDNRYDSLDSRFKEIGFIDKKLIVGKVIMRIYPIAKFGKV
ncbi:signal peptidase I [Clostridium pasteurianum DSM 525 = ATCC 6013]|uniref:Signal peptidase I n=2 Tax=Clostridium pasteurianum TaxID=1501 RepID=A0A0H3JA02_CLOPA|nr:signal peptidase I [Clostridium pasteurianum DSM 525 = ATCC 6013]AOZ79194.1 signal peptidase I [Clostridium pasteurianum]AJA52123.1 signal peptidase I [Clostridium pasteurianum DSM 525 = ATCC 6013]AOZ75399.1 signal peptidase I [Clostridium pasteurianum DSM 525 = ATCC 6013]ELP60712.1 signal peptidase I [Clostridium pasteurianum DSM 525 = ATCC 6013]